MSKTWIIGDIHGANKALEQCLERAGVNKKEDTVIQLGDVCDGWNEVYEAVETLLSIDHLISLKGNHDEWFLDFLIYGAQGAKWLQGGEGTLHSYCVNTDSLYEGTRSFGFRTSLNNMVIPSSHITFFRNQLHYYVDKDNNCFVHGGFNRHHTMEQNEKEEAYQFWWDRDLWYSALSHKQVDAKFKMVEDFKEVFIGHTTTETWGKDTPMQAANIWNLDQGAGWSGKLTIMDLETHNYYQSDKVSDLYPDQRGRN